jgi:hypothetical protein
MRLTQSEIVGPSVANRLVPLQPHSQRAIQAKQMGCFQGVGALATAFVAPLTETDKNQLRACEGVLQKGLSTFFEVGNALLTIREKRLYGATHPTFENYCRERWGIGRSYAWRVISAAERLNLLPPDDSLPKPASEFQMRPFLKLEPEEFPKVWEQVAKRARDGKVTPTLVRAVISELPPGRVRPVAAARKSKPGKSRSKIPLGQILVLLQEAKRRVEKGEVELALAALDRIESVLFGEER